MRLNCLCGCMCVCMYGEFMVHIMSFMVICCSLFYFMESSQVLSCISMELVSNISETVFISIIRS